MTGEAEHKKATLIYMLGSWSAIMFWCDGRRPGVVAPEGFQKAQLVFRVGRDLTPPVDNLVIDDNGVAAGLMFNGALFRVNVPWDAIYMAVAVGDDRAMVWAASVPEDVKLGGDESAPPEPEIPPKRPNHLKLVP